MLHVDTGALAWTRYAVAAVPPVAAMLALAALLRQVYRLAADRAVETGPAGQPIAQVAHSAIEAAQAALRATVAAGNPLSGRQLAERFGLNRAQVAQVRSTVLAESNGHADTDTG